MRAARTISLWVTSTAYLFVPERERAESSGGLLEPKGPLYGIVVKPVLTFDIASPGQVAAGSPLVNVDQSAKYEKVA